MAIIQVEGLPNLQFERDLVFSDTDRNLTSAWSERNSKAQNAMKCVKRARMALEA